MAHILRIAGILLGVLFLYGAVGSEMFLGSLMVAVGLIYLSWVPFIWIPLGLMILGGLLKEPFLFPALVIGFGYSFQLIKP